MTDKGGIPKGKEWYCKKCGKLSKNRINCPSCLKSLTKGISEEFEEFIFIGEGVINEDRLIASREEEGEELIWD